MNEFEKNLEQLKETAERGKKLERLYQVPEFKELILEGYLKNEPERLTEILGSFAANGLQQGLVTPGQNDRMEYADKLRRDCIRAVEGVSNFHTYLKVIFAKGDQAEVEIEAHQEEEAQRILEQESDQ